MNPAVWLLIGFVAGNLVPRRHIHRWRSTVMPRVRALRMWLHEHVIAVATAAIVLVMLIGVAPPLMFGYLVQQGRERDDHNAAVAACQARVNTALLDALHARSDTARRAILAPSDFFVTLKQLLVHPAKTKAEKAHALADLIAANKSASRAYYAYIQAQEDNPLPKIPDCSMPR